MRSIPSSLRRLTSSRKICSTLRDESVVRDNAAPCSRTWYAMLLSASTMCSATTPDTESECIAVMVWQASAAFDTRNAVKGNCPFRRLINSCLARVSFVVQTSTSKTTTW